MLIATLAVSPCRAGDPPSPAQNAKDADPADAQRFWVQTDYLLRWTRGNSLPPLVTASPAGTARNLAGVLPGAQILFGGSNVDGEGRHGARLAFGYWLQHDRRYAIEVSVDWLGDNGGTHFAASSSGASFLARPFFDANLDAPSALLVSAPGVFSGAVSSSTFTQALSASAGLRKNWRQTGRWRIDLLGGYRYFQYRETLKVQQSSTVIGGQLPLGTTISGADDFNAKNDFHGGEAGLAAEWHRDRWSASMTPKVALGVVHKLSRINGDTAIDGGAPLVGDLLALSSNIGSRSENSFAALPEARLVGRYDVSRHLGFTLGYTVRYLSSVLRTSGQIDLTVNPNLLPPGVGGGPARPQPQMNTSGLWSHGLNAGLEFRF
ncbi:MAG: BBP7 family outer membrane beta-barrel protein [Acidobacteriia bacterium]|nr:BBP7 family outer membrane beta-barrel protein [Terriglobia bacterium]